MPRPHHSGPWPLHKPRSQVCSSLCASERSFDYVIAIFFIKNLKYPKWGRLNCPWSKNRTAAALCAGRYPFINKTSDIVKVCHYTLCVMGLIWTWYPFIPVPHSSPTFQQNNPVPHSSGKSSQGLETLTKDGHYLHIQQVILNGRTFSQMQFKIESPSISERLLTSSMHVHARLTCYSIFDSACDNGKTFDFLPVIGSL